ncbi:MAG: PfkB family carbohydrate kinase [Nocardioides sp.]|uniref:1-phosphofructokinase family hexose kinase n=1 Tax=Nocardioides sp. TaxID=35761 RepID=UPI0039E259D9
MCPNPALDVTYGVGELRHGEVHPVVRVHRRAGGKAVNTARVLHHLRRPTLLLAPLGGSTGSEVAADLERAGIALHNVPLAGTTRTSVAVTDGSGATVFNEPGPEVSPHEWRLMVETLRAQAIADGVSVVVLAGSLPPGAPVDGYAQLIEACGARPVVLDAAGAALASALPASPAVVTPNLAEARDALDTAGGALECAEQLVLAGARAAVVSDGAHGLTAVCDAARWTARPDAPVSGNPTGAGDAVTAVLALGLAEDIPPRETLRRAVAVAGGAVAAPVAGDIDDAVTARLQTHVLVEEASR